MPRRDDKTLLKDILDSASAGVKAVQGRTQADLANDFIWKLGLVKCLEIIGEAVGRLSERIRQRHNEVSWPQIIGMRNRLVHAYFEIDQEQLWKALLEDLPQLIKQIEAVLDSEFPNS
jgi:uncharacterized protein with HEPN domain